MADDACLHDAAELAGLRRWAWQRGRTDVILDLDLHEVAWDFRHCPDRRHLVRLAALLPAGRLDRDLGERVSRLANAGGGGRDLDEVRAALLPACQQLCLRVAADLDEVPAAARPPL